jgi:predicted transcriptional regulator
MRALWDADAPLSAGDIRHGFSDDEGGEPALTTILTILERLRAKGRVVKHELPEGGLRFEAAVPESRAAASAMISALLGSRDRSAALLRFAGDLDADDAALLRRALGPDGDDAD